MDKKNFLYKFFGIYFFVLGVLSVYNATQNSDVSLLWICYISIFLLSFGFFFKEYKLLFVQLNILFVPMVFWNLDFFYRLFTGNSLWGVTDYFFELGLNSIWNFITLEHVYVVPLLIVVLYFEKFDKKLLWLWSFAEMYLIFILSILVADPIKNVNCVRESCIDYVGLSGASYSFAWFFVVFLMIFITNFAMSKMLGEK